MENNIVIDSREQKPFSFKNSIVKTLHTGDYSIEGYEKEIAIERKSITDAINSVIKGRERFEKEWNRALTFKRFYIIIEGNIRKISQEITKQAIIRNRTRNLQGNIKGVIHTYIHWCVKYNIPIFFCETRTEANYVTKELLKAYIKYKEQEGLL